METVVCKHEEDVVSEFNGIELGTCRICGQEIQYNTRDLKASPFIKKLGRIDGKVVLPNLALSTSLLRETDRLDLKEAKKFIPKVIEESAAGVPARPKKGKQLRAYFEENKEAIIADYYGMLRLDFFKKWGINAGSWLELHKEWEVTLKGPGGGRKGTTKRSAPEKQRKSKKDIIPAAPRKAQEQQEGLPPFPPFSDSWIPSVQIEWFQTYKELKLETLLKVIKAKLNGVTRGKGV